jgi:uncharacterized RDD family membrane protein YckC
VEGVSTSSTGRSTGSGPSEGRSRSTYAGERLGRPAEGPGAVAGWGRRLLALTVDWVASLLVAMGLTAGAAMSSRGWETWVPMLVFLVESSVLVPLLGGSFGQLLTRVAVVRLDGRPIGLLPAILRAALVCLVVPPLIYNPDRRGLHDLLTGTLTIRRS